MVMRTDAERVRLKERAMRRTFLPSLGVISIVVIGLLFGLTRYTELGVDLQDQLSRYYQYFIHIQIMVWVGFAFLYSFLRRYSLGATALNYLGSCLMFLLAILCVGAAHQTLGSKKQTMIELDLPLLIDCSFCAATGMIAFGAVIGKASPTQLIWMMLALVPLFAVNQWIVVKQFHILDAGGGNVVHTLGAYYGLAVSYMLSRQSSRHEHPKAKGSHNSDTLAMVGVLFIWVLWPSFNAALMSAPHVAHSGMTGGVPEKTTEARASEQGLCIINTLLALCGSTVAAFMTSSLVCGRLSIVHIQNSSLAGAVAIAAACSLRMSPGAPLVVGLVAGALSVLGYQYLGPYLHRKIGLQDTAGIHNLHGLPGVMGCVVAGLAALGQSDTDYLLQPSGKLQLAYQVAGVVVCVCLALSWGSIVGFTLLKFNPLHTDDLTPAELFDDAPWWHEVDLEPLSSSTDLSSQAHSSMVAGPTSSVHANPLAAVRLEGLPGAAAAAASGARMEVHVA